MSVLGRPIYAVIFGAFIACAETCLHFENIVRPTSWIDLPLHDWLAAALLVHSGVRARRDWTTGRPYLAAAWGFMVSLLAGAFLAHWENWSPGPHPDEWISEKAFLSILFGLLLVAALAMIGTIRRRS